MTDLSLGAQPDARADWEKSAATVLRRLGRMRDEDPDSAVWDELTARTLDGIGVPPLGTAALVAGLPAPGLPGQRPFVRGSAAARADKAWDIRPSFADADPARTAEAVLTDLENGATSLWLTLGAGGLAVEDLATVLEKVFIDLAPVILDAPEDPAAAADAFLAAAASRDLSPAPGTNLGADPIGAAVRAGQDPHDVDGVVAAMATRAVDHGVRALVVDATAVHDLGSSDVQELAYSLAVGAAYLRSLTAAGLDLDDAATRIEFRYAATDEQFGTIAKLRAARRLWHRVAELSGVSVAARAQAQHAVTSRPMMSKFDSYTNLLRTTVAAFAAGVGGASAVTVLPFDTRLGLPDAFSRRIARNTSSLLISEAHVAEVTDPAGGAYAVEKLTDDLARAGWAELGRIERSGGVPGDGLAALRSQIAETVAERTRQVATRARPLTGVSEFPNLHETLPERKPYPDVAFEVLAYGADFEALRDARMDTPVFLATLGTVSAHTARATFATNVFAAGGIDTGMAGPTSGVEEVLAAYDGAPVVCLAGADTAYAQWGADLVAALRSAGARWIALAGSPVDGVEVDASVAVGSDILAFLQQAREQLEVSP